MASKVPIIVYDYVRRALVKSSEGIASLPNKQAIMSSMQDIFNRLKSGGYNAITAEKVIKNQDDLRKVLNTIDSKEIADITKRKKQSEGIQEVMDKMEKGVPLNPSDQAKMEGGTPDKVLDAFRGFEPKIIQGGKAEGIEQLLKSGDVKRGLAPKTTKETIERKSMIDPKLTQEENIKNMMAENKASAKRLEQKTNPKKDLGDRLKDYDGDPDAMAIGGRAGFYVGGIVNVLSAFKAAFRGKYKNFLVKKKRYPSIKERTKLIDEAEQDIKTNFPEEYAEFPNPSQSFRTIKGSRVDKDMEADMERQSMGFFPKTQEDDIRRLMDDGPEMTLDDIINLRQNKAAGGIAMLAEGGPENKGRRTFLKAAAGLASIPILGKFFKPAAKVVDKAGPAVAEGVKLGFSKFMMLVDKIKRLGRKTDGVTQNSREEGYLYTGKNGDTYELVEDISTGDVRITKDKVGIGSYDDKTFDTIEDRSTFVLRRNQADETTKGRKPPDEYDEMKEVAGPDGTFEDVDEVSDIAVEEVLEELGETRIKKAGGGLAHMLGE